jgi:hypothetical protein
MTPLDLHSLLSLCGRFSQFFETICFKIRLSKPKSATNYLSQRFSVSRSFNRLTSLTSILSFFTSPATEVWSLDPASRANSLTLQPATYAFRKSRISSSVCLVLMLSLCFYCPATNISCGAVFAE